MHRLTICLVWCLYTVAAYISFDPRAFYFTKNSCSMFIRSDDDCKVCFNGECFTQDESRCEYYAETSEILKVEEEEPPEENDLMKMDVDNKLHVLVSKVATVPEFHDCIPLISQYTDCTKDNICSGCTVCECDSNGQWACNDTHKCKPDEAHLDIDHRVLISIVEKLRDDNSTDYERRKRSINESDIAHELSIKLFGNLNKSDDTKPINNKKVNEGDSRQYFIQTNITNTVNNVTYSGTKKVDVNLAFDDLLNNLAIDERNYRRRKPPLDLQHSENSFYEIMNIATNYNNTNEPHQNNKLFIVRNNEKINESETIDKNTNIFIDLLYSSNKTHQVSHPDITNITYLLNTDEILPNSITTNASDVIIKRDIQNTSSTLNVIHVATEIPVDGEEVKNIYSPLNDIINDKVKELNQLRYIRDNLAKYANIQGTYDNREVSKTNETELNKNLRLSLYKLEVLPHLYRDFRRKNQLEESLDYYVNKVKIDIYEVIQDYSMIQKLASNDAILPEGLTSLIHDMKRYLFQKATKRSDYLKSTNKSEFNNIFIQKLKDYIIDILESVDRDMPDTNALSPLSFYAKRLLKRVIKSNYLYDPYQSYKTHDPRINLTEDLIHISKNWRGVELVNDVTLSSPYNQLYNLKRLQLLLSIDIEKMEHALHLISFSHNRRMILVSNDKEEDIMTKINKNLEIIGKKLEYIIDIHKENKTHPAIAAPKNRRYKQVSNKLSILNQLKNLLKGSKKDVLKLLEKKVPTPEIVKTIARKKIDEITRNKMLEYRNAMTKWQKALKVGKKTKRSVVNHKVQRFSKFTTSRMKNIIPLYLRGKVKPALSAKDFKKDKRRWRVTHDKVPAYRSPNKIIIPHDFPIIVPTKAPTTLATINFPYYKKRYRNIKQTVISPINRQKGAKAKHRKVKTSSVKPVTITTSLRTTTKKVSTRRNNGPSRRTPTVRNKGSVFKRSSFKKSGLIRNIDTGFKLNHTLRNYGVNNVNASTDYIISPKPSTATTQYTTELSTTTISTPLNDHANTKSTDKYMTAADQLNETTNTHPTNPENSIADSISKDKVHIIEVEDENILKVSMKTLNATNTTPRNMDSAIENFNSTKTNTSIIRNTNITIMINENIHYNSTPKIDFTTVKTTGTNITITPNEISSTTTTYAQTTSETTSIKTSPTTDITTPNTQSSLINNAPTSVLVTSTISDSTTKNANISSTFESTSESHTTIKETTVTTKIQSFNTTHKTTTVSNLSRAGNTSNTTHKPKLSKKTLKSATKVTNKRPKKARSTNLKKKVQSRIVKS